MTWTQFWDMHSGGATKEPPFEKIYIEAPKAEAESIFYTRFGHNPERVTCTCCGDDYAIDESATLEEATAYNRRLPYIAPSWAVVTRWSALTAEQRTEANKVSRYLEPDELMPDGFSVSHNAHGEPLTVEQYLASPSVLAITADEITDDERTAAVPEQGYIWQD